MYMKCELIGHDVGMSTFTIWQCAYQQYFFVTVCKMLMLKNANTNIIIM